MFRADAIRVALLVVAAIVWWRGAGALGSGGAPWRAIAAAGMDYFLAKPVDADELARVLAAVAAAPA